MKKNEIIMEESATEIDKINEMIIHVYDSLPTEIENSIYYPKLRQLLHMEIVRFCKEQYELREDLNIFRQLVGEAMEEKQIRDYLDELKAKYNNQNTNVGLNYHIEVTRWDYSCVVFVCIKRENVHMKKFVFRFRKKGGLSQSLNGLTFGGLIAEE